MKVAVITIAGISSRFNEGIPEEKKCHKIIYYEKKMENSLLYHLIEKCMYSDRIILVGGNKYEDVEAYCGRLPDYMGRKLELVYNEHYADYSSGYSLYVGLNVIFDRYNDVEEVLFVEGDLDIDRESFERVVMSPNDVLTFSYEPIYANKAVVLYKNAKEQYRYAFNTNHGLLDINEPFSVILNSGQLWKFRDIGRLHIANDRFFECEKEGTNLCIIQNYIDMRNSDNFELIALDRWTNCNTRDDYSKILSYWEEESI